MRFRLADKKDKMRKLLIIIFFAVVSAVNGQNIPDTPTPQRLVNDFASILTRQQIEALEDSLVTFYRQTSTQITIVTTNDLGGTSVDDYAYKLGEKWGVGHDGRNNGIVMIVKPKTRESRGEAFIATGYGLEGVVPDLVARRIVDSEMIPHFRENDYAGGIEAGVRTLMQLTRGEFTAEGYLNDDSATGLGAAIIFIFFIIFIVILAASSKNNQSTSIGKDIGMMTFLSMLAASNRNNHGKWDNFNSGSGSFGGFGGSSRGGFGGFGGGHFGGGGAGGSW